MEETLEKQATVSLILGNKEKGDDAQYSVGTFYEFSLSFQARKIVRGKLILSMQYLCFKSSKKCESEVLVSTT